MAAPYLPQVIVNTDFQQVSSAAIAPLQACIVGPHAQAIRHAIPAERPLGWLDDYQPAVDTTYPWPSLAAGGLVDLASVRLFADDAKLLFFSDLRGEGQTVAPVSGRANQVSISGTAGFAANGSHARLAGLYGRDVKLGDRVRVAGVVSGQAVALDTYVTGFDGANDAAVVAAASRDAANKGTQAASANVSQVAGATNCLAITADESAYVGLADGAISETYTVTVIQGSVGTDTTTALLRLRSASGLDDVVSFQAPAIGASVSVGSRGLSIGLAQSGGTACDLVAGQAWQVTITQQFTATQVTSGGTYLGASDDTYVVTITRGGLLADSDPDARPQWTVTTVKGLDASGPTTIGTAALAYPVGTQGATLMVAGGTTGLCKGDRFYVAVTAAKPGLRNRLVLANSLPASLQGLTDLDLLLYKQADIEIPRARAGYDPITNFAATSGAITVAAGIVVRDPDFVDNSGNALPLSLIAGALYAEYRAFLPSLSYNVDAIADIGEIDAAISGANDPVNPLKYAVAKALGGSAGSDVLFISVANPADPTSWTAAISKLVGREDVYNIVPLTHDPAIISLFAAHVSAQSGAAAGHERALVIGLVPTTARQVVGPTTSSDGGLVLATVGDDPDSAGTQYTLLSVPADNAHFVANGVQAGDEVRFGYSTSYGAPVYGTATVGRVINETSLLLATAWPAPVTLAQRLEIWHKLSNDEIKEDLKAKAAAISDRRHVAVWSDLIGLATPTIDTYYMAAAVAGLISGVLPHQSLTNTSIDGFADVVLAAGLFNSDEVADLCGNGVWVISRTPSVQSNAVVTRLATTTDPSSIAYREEMIRRNVDSMVRFCRNRWSPYLGTSNVTPAMEATLRVEVDAAHSYLKASGFTQRLGGQLIDATDVSIAPDPVLADRYNVDATWHVPSPLGTIVVNASIVI